MATFFILDQMYRSIPKPPFPPNLVPRAFLCPPPHPLANPRAFDFFEKFWLNSPLCCQFRRSNAPPVRASRRVPQPSGKTESLTFGNKFCKIFSHCEFLVQLVFAPRFKQRHIPRYNYAKRQQQKKSTWNRAMTRAEAKYWKSFCFRPLLTDVLTGKSNTPLGGPHFGSNSPLYEA